MERVIDGEFMPLNRGDAATLIAEYDSDCERCDIICPTFESWLIAKLWDAREGF